MPSSFLSSISQIFTRDFSCLASLLLARLERLLRISFTRVLREPAKLALSPSAKSSSMSFCSWSLSMMVTLEMPKSLVILFFNVAVVLTSALSTHLQLKPSTSSLSRTRSSEYWLPCALSSLRHTKTAASTRIKLVRPLQWTSLFAPTSNRTCTNRHATSWWKLASLNQFPTISTQGTCTIRAA